MKRRMYIDESGNPGLGHLDDPNNRFLSLTGVIIDIAYANEIVRPAMEELKLNAFGKSVVLHREEIVKRLGPFSVLNDENVRAQFNHGVLTLLSEWDYSVISVCLDKKQWIDQRRRYAVEHPYQQCLVALMEQFRRWLKERGVQGDLMIEARGTREDRNLKELFRARMESDAPGSSARARDFRRAFTSKELKIQPKSANEAGLQIADLLAHPSRVQILREHGLWDRPPQGFASEIINRALTPKYYRQDGVATDFGKILLPVADKEAN